jgi:hypothetical protein
MGALFGAPGCMYGVNSREFGLQFAPLRPMAHAYSAGITRARHAPEALS